MKRALLIVLVLAAAAAAAVTSSGAGGKDTVASYTVELDNAFGLVEGADLKIAGVRAGRITDMRVNRQTKRALVDFDVTQSGFGSLRSDVFCESRPQSLIGEYFIDCLPGTEPEEWPQNKVIPVTRTASTIPADLINNIMRRPYRERLRIILNELGAGVGARSQDLNDAIRRASPALRETDRVLAILARQNRVLANLVRDADTVIGDLAGNKEDVSRWVSETRQTAAASAERRTDIARGLGLLPEFLRELRPTMAELGRVADAQAPTLADLNASAGELERFFTNLEPFTKSTQVNLRSLGDAAQKGRPAVRAARPVVAELNKLSEKTPELANNLDIVLAHLDDRANAVEPDPRAPEGKGYTGFEALLQYIFDQGQAINIFDANTHMLKVNLFFGECTDYQSADSVKEHLAEDPEFLNRCMSELGPNQQGITSPDPTAPAQARKRAQRERKQAKAKPAPAATAKPTPEAEKKPVDKPSAVKPPIDLGDTFEDLLDGRLPDIKLPQVKPGLGLRDETSRDALLDFLFGV